MPNPRCSTARFWIEVAVAVCATGYAHSQVSGPPSSTDKAIPRWDGGHGDALLDSSVTIDDANKILGVKSLENIRYASEFASISSKTGGIQEAIDDCGSGLSTQGCTVVLPAGEVAVSTTIYTDGSGMGKEGLVLIGHGSGEKNSLGMNLGGTTLLWTGDDNTPGPHTVLSVRSTSFSRFSDFAIDGGGHAVTGIDVTTEECSPTPCSPSATQQNLFENIYITNLKQDSTDTIGVRVAPPDGTNYQVSESTFRHFVITEKVAIGFMQDGQQTSTIRYENNNLATSWIGIKIARGLATLTANAFVLTTGSDADVWIGQSARAITLLGNVHEIRGNYGIYTEPDTLEQDGWRYAPTTVIGDTLQQYNNNGYVVWHEQVAPFNLIGCNVFGHDPGTTARMDFHNPNTAHDGNSLRITSSGGQYSSTQWDFSGDYALMADDGASSSNQANSILPITWSNVGLVRNGGSDNWALSDGTKKYGWYLAGNDLVFSDGASSPNTLGFFTGADWTTNGQFVSRVATPFKLTGGGSYANSIAVQTLTANQTITLPNRTGTALVSGDTLSGHVTGTLTDGSTSTTIAAETSAFVFSYPVTQITAQTWFGPNMGQKGSSADAVSVPVTAMTAKSLWCKLSNAPGSGSPTKSWTLTAQTGSGNGTTLLSCSISGASSTTCSATGSVAWTAGSNLSLRATPTNSPAATFVFCSLGVSPN